MGDGQVRKLAFIINGDNNSDLAQEHEENVERSIDVLEAEGYETWVVNPSYVGSADHWMSPTLEGIEFFSRSIKERIDDDDELVIFTTGHGDENESEGTLCLPDGCIAGPLASALDITGYGRRTVIMGQCFSGNWNRIFLNDPRTSLITQGSFGEVVISGEFLPYLWASDAPDSNGDGIIDWQERYAYALSDRTMTSTPQFITSPDEPSGTTAGLSAETDRMNERIETLMKDIDDPDIPTRIRALRNLAALGTHLNTDDLERIAAAYYELLNVDDPALALTASTSLAMFGRLENMTADQNWSRAQLRILEERLDDSDPVVRAHSVVAYGMLAWQLDDAKEIDECISVVERVLRDSDVDVRESAAYVYGTMMRDMSRPDLDIAPLLRKLAGEIYESDPSITDVFNEAAQELEDRDTEAQGMEKLRGLFFHPDEIVRRGAFYCYAHQIRLLTSSTAGTEARELREIMEMTDMEIHRRSADLYGDNAERLLLRTRSDAQEEFSADPFNISVRWNITEAYIGLVAGMSETRQDGESDALLGIIDDTIINDESRISAFHAYYRLGFLLERTTTGDVETH